MRTALASISADTAIRNGRWQLSGVSNEAKPSPSPPGPAKMSTIGIGMGGAVCAHHGGVDVRLQDRTTRQKVKVFLSGIKFGMPQ